MYIENFNKNRNKCTAFLVECLSVMYKMMNSYTGIYLYFWNASPVCPLSLTLRVQFHYRLEHQVIFYNSWLMLSY